MGCWGGGRACEFQKDWEANSGSTCRCIICLTAHHLGFTDTCPYPVFMFVQRGVLIENNVCSNWNNWVTILRVELSGKKRAHLKLWEKLNQVCVCVCVSILPLHIGHLYHSCRFHIHVLMWDICFSLTSFILYDRLLVHPHIYKWQFPSFLWPCNIALGSVLHLIYSPVCCWAFRVIPCPCCCKWGGCDHWGTVSWVYAQE